MFRVLPTTLAVLMACGVNTPSVQAQREAAGVRVPEGFNIQLFADDDLAHDIHSLTIDTRGRVVVSGPGYVRFLIDEDGDGKADRAKEFVDGPKSGAQGMFFVGRDLLLSGDNGLRLYRDDNRDDKADKAPEVFLGILAGGEHHAHSIQKGPDGWWYVIAGNYAGVTDAYIKDPKTGKIRASSPIKKPYAGVIMRIRPDLGAGEIVTDGFRNAYDFGFNRLGDIFTFDSDGERDVSLPWYRPTRVFHATPASNAGWVSRSWKNPGYFADMPPVIGDFGRGSPSGVVVYNHNQFPTEYRGAVLGLDWTYGRVIALPLKQNGSVWTSKPVELMTGVGSFGFAPTDAEIGPDGSLYVSVGGRGTRGGVYKVTYGPGGEKEREYAETDAERLTQVLEAQQPLAAWSRNRWERVAKRLGRDPFVKAVLNERLGTSARIRAIEILTEMFEGIDDRTAAAMVRSKSAGARARVAWALGRRDPAKPSVKALAPYLKDTSPMVQRFALEAFQCATDKTDWKAAIPLLVPGLGSKDRFVRQAASRVVSRLPAKILSPLANAVQKSGVADATVALGLGLVQRSRTVVPNVLSMGMVVLEPTPDKGAYHPIALRLESARAMQLALGDMGPGENRLAVYEGYAPRADLTESEQVLNPFRTRIAKVFPTGDDRLDLEVSRVIAMLAPLNDALLDKVLAKIGPKSDPVSDVHYLLVASRIAVDRSQAQTDHTARALAALDRKISERKYPQDANWNARIGELYATLVKNDEMLPVTIAELPSFGRPAHVVFLSQLPKEDLPIAIKAFASKIEADEDYKWSNDVVFVLGESKDPKHVAMVREQLENEIVSNAAVMVLSREPMAADRQLFVDSLDTPDRGILTSSVNAISKLPKGGSAREFVYLVKTARRLGGLPVEFQLRETAIRVLQQNTGQNFGFEFGEEGYKPQTEVLNKWSAYVERKYPQEAELLNGGAAKDLAAIAAMMDRTDWKAGDATRGSVLFENLSCAQCHRGSTALGPDLGGVTGRFSRKDLFTAIVAPNKDVSTRYQTTVVQIVDGRPPVQGLVIYRSVDGLLLRTPQNQTIRLEGSEVEFTRALSTSLMPAGLLKKAKPTDLADLYAYLETLKQPVAPRIEPTPDPMEEEEKKKAAANR